MRVQYLYLVNRRFCRCNHFEVCRETVLCFYWHICRMWKERRVHPPDVARLNRNRSPGACDSKKIATGLGSWKEIGVQPMIQEKLM